MPYGLPTVGTIAHVGTGKTTMIGAIMTALRLQEARGHVPHTCAGFMAYHRSLHGVDATAQDVWNAAIRSFKDLNRTTASPMGAQASQDGSELTGEYQWTEEKKQEFLHVLAEIFGWEKRDEHGDDRIKGDAEGHAAGPVREREAGPR